MPITVSVSIWFKINKYIVIVKFQKNELMMDSLLSLITILKFILVICITV